MDEKFILRNEELFSMRKRVIKEERESEEIDGMSYSSYTMQHSFTPREPDYIKVYNNYRFLMNKSNPALMQFMLAFCENMRYANDSNKMLQHTIRIDKLELKRVAAICGVSVSRVRHAKDDLVKEEVFIPVYSDGERVQGLYYVNPWVAGRGDWNSIKKHRDSFRFVTGDDKIRTFIQKIKDPKTNDFERITVVTSGVNQYGRIAGEELADIS